jgi:hypothetical protein
MRWFGGQEHVWIPEQGDPFLTAIAPPPAA